MILKNGYIVSNNKLVKKDILIKDNIIKAIDDNINLDNEEIIDVNNKLVMPGLVDVHVTILAHAFKALYAYGVFSPWCHITIFVFSKDFCKNKQKE